MVSASNTPTEPTAEQRQVYPGTLTILEREIGHLKGSDPLLELNNNWRSRYARLIMEQELKS